ncbi:6-phospho-beta-glucosidase OS=Streptomyces paromomycinus OX=92743 GN=GKJPGBOP_05487 PE=3 SV=1 [Streptomyces rimosus subsp. rimosus]
MEGLINFTPSSTGSLPATGGTPPHHPLKIAVVGGGSTYTPELIDGFARLRDALPLAELVLIDPAADRLELVGGLARRIFAKQGHPGRISWTSDVDAGVDGADAVLLQLRVGGQAARNQDETWPLECGCVGQETTGAGGLAKALRTVPVVLDIAERIRRRNPDAWIVDFTNPVGTSPARGCRTATRP